MKAPQIRLHLGGETVVTVQGDGIAAEIKIALASVPCLANVPGNLVFSVGSDGTTGRPTLPEDRGQYDARKLVKLISMWLTS